MTVTHDVQLAMSADFLRAFSGLPKPLQKKTRTFIDKFRDNPDSPALNYESLHAMRDSKVRTARIDQKYRAVIVHPDEGNLHLLVWVDNHNEAMAWAKNKVFEVNRYTGTFQVYEPVDAGEQVVDPPASRAVETVPTSTDVVADGFLLQGHRAEDLLLLGVPEPLMPALLALRTAADLDALNQYLPEEASDAVYMLASGYSVDEVLDEFDRKEKSANEAAKQIDTEDIETALKRSGSRRQFKLVEDDDELASMLAAPMARWRIFLHPSQEKLVHMASKGSARVLGGAGTGKTVVAMHRIRHLARDVFTKPQDRLLFTTFTKNLAADIRANLKQLCGPELERIEVKHLQEVARDVLAAQGVATRGTARRKQIEQAWSDVFAMNEQEFPAVFYREEWDKVVQAQGVTDLAGYLRARRAGRGQRLSRRQRIEAWDILAQYRANLDRAGYWEFADVIREAKCALEKGSPPYQCVVADEVQDFSAEAMRLLRGLVPEGPNDIFVVGDPHQRIYGHRASLARCGISIRGRRSRKLRVNYRTTQKIRNWAVAKLEGLEFDDLDESTDTLKGERSLRLGDAPSVRMCASEKEELNVLVATIQGWIDDDDVKPADICICARTNTRAEHYADALKQRGITTRIVTTDAADDHDEAVRVATMHRVKGLEFSRVVLVDANERTVPYRDKEFFNRDDTARELYEAGERQVLYVLATRARDAFMITGHGERSPWV